MLIILHLKPFIFRCQTVIDILVKHAFDNVSRFTSKQREAIEKLWASIREQQTRRKQGKSVSGKLDVNAFEWLQQKYATEKISIRHAVGGRGDRRCEQWLGWWTHHVYLTPLCHWLSETSKKYRISWNSLHQMFVMVDDCSGTSQHIFLMSSCPMYFLLRMPIPDSRCPMLPSKHLRALLSRVLQLKKTSHFQSGS